MLTYLELIAKLKPIRLLLLDVDGVLTDGKYYLTGAGDETKGFSSLDGHGIRMAQRAGLHVGLLTGRVSEGVARYAEGLEIKILVQRSYQKETDYERILAEHSLSDAEVAFMGDDVVDLPILRRCGFSITTSDAEPWIQSCVCHVTRRRGGQGAVREVVDLLLKAQGKWDEAMSRYVR
ncbi:MAG: phenylphosphate carboxylase subunit delta [Acidobacteria bacterium]|nr:phenylphosphate carboxylase subunit delta [Acidobacteriota bacterium]